MRTGPVPRGEGGEESGRLLVANLGFEDELRAWAAGSPASPGTEGLSVGARRTAAAAGTLLRVFARDGDRLWLPASVNLDRLGRSGLLAALPVPALETGPVEELAPAARVLAWGESPSVARLRALNGRNVGGVDARVTGSGGPARATLRSERLASTLPLHEVVWHLEPPPSEVVARVAHRAFCLELARELGLALPGARMVDGPEELEEHLRTGSAAGEGAWVVKAPYSAAGRERLLGTGLDLLRPGRRRRRLEGLFTRHGSLLFEPWVRRLADFGCTGLVTRTTIRLAGHHRLEVDERGAFRGIALSRKAQEAEDAPGLASEEQNILEATFHAVAARLQTAGYNGPVGLDAYRWRTPEGTDRFHPLGELNPRITVGLVARSLAERLADTAEGDAGPDPPRRLHLVLAPSGPPGAHPLLAPASDGSPGAWISLPVSGGDPPDEQTSTA